jgi:hypothetical protein
MTSETHNLIQADDIPGIELECPDCHARVFYPVEKNFERISHQCPNCNRDWFTVDGSPYNRGSVTLEQVKLLLKVLKLLGKPGADMHAILHIHVNVAPKG